ncbi:MAG: adenylyl-sulfate kinase [Bacillota bacterium]
MNKVYWITGLSGSGKTTIGKALYEKIQQSTEKVIFLDGDTMRNYIGFDVGYSDIERRNLGIKYSGLCEMLYRQGFTIVCCTIAMFDEIRDLNRKNIENYVEVYVKVNLEVLHQRDQKNLYSSKATNVVGVDIPPELPKNPDIIIENDCCENIDGIVNNILSLK